MTRTLRAHLLFKIAKTTFCEAISYRTEFPENGETGDPACVESDHPAAAVTCLDENCAGVWCFNCRGGNLRCPVCGGQGAIIDSFRRPPILASKPRRKVGAR